MNYSAVAPPSQSGSGDPQSAFADALARARQIAAKINTQPTSDGEPSAMKRPFEGTSDNQPDAKKIAALNDPIGAQLRAIADQQRSSQAAQAAAAAASQINAKLGIEQNSQPRETLPPPMAAGMGLGGHGGLGGMVTTDNYSVPDRMVGLIIGKGGEQIAAIQAETGCKVQFAPDSGGMPERPCTLTGSAESIDAAKEMISRIIAKGQDPNQVGDGGSMVEIMVSGPKVGLVIGKGGETIKHLQEKCGVKMVMIQDSNQPSNYDKPLRITGEPAKCQMARDMVMELISSKDDDFGGGNDYGDRRNQMEIPVPRNLVGVIIGRGGEMIKKIQTETGAKVQFKQDDGQGPERMCTVTGGQDKVQQAASMINELVETALARDGGGGRGRGRGRGDDHNGSFGDGRPGGGRDRFGGDFQDETDFTVPADKCGLIIGKGGETIREINRQSGAHVELSRNQPPNPRERVFKVSGDPGQIQQALRMMSEKAGVPPPNGPNGPGGHGPPPGQGPGGYDPYGQYGGQYGGPQHQQGGPQNYAPQGWGNAYNQWNQSAPNDPSPHTDKQAADANAQAWAAYYQQFYSGQGQPGQPNMGQQPGQQQPGQPPQQQQQQQQPPQSQPQPSSGPPTTGQTATPTINPTTGQPDYSAAWAEYYRQQGMHYHAQAILQQSGGGGPGQQTSQNPAPPGQ